jgi:hypothetical protein
MRAVDLPAALFSSKTDDDEGGAPATAVSTVASSTPSPIVAPIAFTIGTAHGTVVSMPRLVALTTAASPEKSSPAPSPAPANDDEGSGVRTVGYVAGGVGLVGMALFAIAGLGAKNAYDKLDSECGQGPCTDEAHRSDIDAGRMFQTTANIGLAAGLTGLGVGATLLVLGSHSSVEKRGTSASVSPSGGMITYGGRF